MQQGSHSDTSSELSELLSFLKSLKSSLNEVLEGLAVMAKKLDEVPSEVLNLVEDSQETEQSLTQEED